MRSASVRRGNVIGSIAIASAISLGLGISLVILPLRVVLALSGVGLWAALTFGVDPFLGMLMLSVLMILRELQVVYALEGLHLVRLAGIATLVAWVVRGVVRRDLKLVSAPQNWLITLFFAIICFSRLDSGVVSGSLVVQSFAKVLIFYFLMINLIDSKDKLRVFLWLIVLAKSYLVLRAWRLYASGEVSVAIPYWWADKNGFAMGLVFFLPLIFALFWTERAVWRRALLGSLACLYIVNIVRAHSRGGLLGLFVVLTLSLVHMFRSSRRRAELLIILAALSIPFLRTLPQISGMVESIKGYKGDASAGLRLSAWRAGIQMIADNPVLGVGADNFDDFFSAYSSAADRLSAHNVFIQVGAETGLAGLLVFLGLMLLTLRDMRRLKTALKSSDHEMRDELNDLLSFIAISLIGFFICGFFLLPAYGAGLYILVGLVVILKRIAQANDILKGSDSESS